MNILRDKLGRFIKGHIKPREICKKISMANKGRKVSDEVRKIISITCKKNGVGKWMKGRKNTYLSNLLHNKMGIKSHAWKGGKIKKICQYCSKEFEITRTKKGVFCSHQCQYKMGHSEETKNKLRMANHPNWKGGISFEPYPLGWTKTFKEQIRYRDKYKCQSCGLPEIESNRKLCVHHIDYNKNNLQEDNLIALCVSCHMKTNYQRKVWEKKFGNIKEEVWVYDTT